jgi:hypothetical protein
MANRVAREAPIADNGGKRGKRDQRMLAVTAMLFALILVVELIVLLARR